MGGGGGRTSAGSRGSSLRTFASGEWHWPHGPLGLASEVLAPAWLCPVGCRRGLALSAHAPSSSPQSPRLHQVHRSGRSAWNDPKAASHTPGGAHAGPALPALSRHCGALRPGNAPRNCPDTRPDPLHGLQGPGGRPHQPHTSFPGEFVPETPAHTPVARAQPWGARGRWGPRGRGGGARPPTRAQAGAGLSAPKSPGRSPGQTVGAVKGARCGLCRGGQVRLRGLVCSAPGTEKPVHKEPPRHGTLTHACRLPPETRPGGLRGPCLTGETEARAGLAMHAGAHSRC